METVIIRGCWFYGPGQPERQTRLMRMIQKGKALKFGDGLNLRSMSYLDNTTQGLMLAEKTKKANGQAYWIADKRPYTTLEVYQAIADELNVRLKTIPIPGFMCSAARVMDGIIQAAGFYISELHVAGEMDQSIACSIEKAEKELGYNPKIELREGMRKSIEWARERKLL